MDKRLPTRSLGCYQNRVVQLTLTELTEVPRWSVERLAALPGRVRGHTFRDWGVHVAKRWGADAPDRVRAHMGVTASVLPDKPTKKLWVPIGHQVRLCYAVVDLFLDGNVAEFESVFNDTSGTSDKVMRWLAMKAGPTAVLKRAGKYHGMVCDAGSCASVARDGAAQLAFVGAPAFDAPGWQVMQMVSMHSLFGVMKRELTTLAGESPEPGSFTLHIAWRDQ